MIAKTSISFEQSLISEWFCCVNAKGNRKCVPGRGQAFLLVLMLSFISSFQNWSSVMGALVHGRANFQPRGVSSINGGGRESAENKRRWLRERGCEHVDRSAERRFGVGGGFPRVTTSKERAGGWLWISHIRIWSGEERGNYSGPRGDARTVRSEQIYRD